MNVELVITSTERRMVEKAVHYIRSNALVSEGVCVRELPEFTRLTQERYQAHLVMNRAASRPLREGSEEECGCGCMS